MPASSPKQDLQGNFASPSTARYWERSGAPPRAAGRRLPGLPRAPGGAGVPVPPFPALEGRPSPSGAASYVAGKEASGTSRRGCEGGRHRLPVIVGRVIKGGKSQILIKTKNKVTEYSFWRSRDRGHPGPPLGARGASPQTPFALPEYAAHELPPEPAPRRCYGKVARPPTRTPALLRLGWRR